MKVWHDGYDWVVAESGDDATEAWEEHTGEKREPGAEPWTEWTRTAYFDMDDGRGRRELTPGAIVAHGRGFFASVNV